MRSNLALLARRRHSEGPGQGEPTGWDRPGPAGVVQEPSPPPSQVAPGSHTPPTPAPAGPPGPLRWVWDPPRAAGWVPRYYPPCTHPGIPTLYTHPGTPTLHHRSARHAHPGTGLVGHAHMTVLGHPRENLGVVEHTQYMGPHGYMGPIYWFTRPFDWFRTCSTEVLVPVLLNLVPVLLIY